MSSDAYQHMALEKANIASDDHHQLDIQVPANHNLQLHDDNHGCIVIDNDGSIRLSSESLSLNIDSNGEIIFHN